MKWLVIGIITGIAVMDILLILGCHELERRRKK